MENNVLAYLVCKFEDPTDLMSDIINVAIRQTREQANEFVQQQENPELYFILSAISPY